MKFSQMPEVCVFPSLCLKSAVRVWARYKPCASPSILAWRLSPALLMLASQRATSWPKTAATASLWPVSHGDLVLAGMSCIQQSWTLCLGKTSAQQVRVKSKSLKNIFRSMMRTSNTLLRCPSASWGNRAEMMHMVYALQAFCLLGYQQRDISPGGWCAVFINGTPLGQAGFQLGASKKFWPHLMHFPRIKQRQPCLGG